MLGVKCCGALLFFGVDDGCGGLLIVDDSVDVGDIGGFRHHDLDGLAVFVYVTNESISDTRKVGDKVSSVRVWDTNRVVKRICSRDDVVDKGLIRRQVVSARASPGLTVTTDVARHSWCNRSGVIDTSTDERKIIFIKCYPTVA